MNRRRLILALTFPFFGGCATIVASIPVVATSTSESLRDNSVDANLKRNAAEANRIKKLADGGDHYAKIELAKKCFEAGYPCLVDDPAQVFKLYSDQGIGIASYYYASYRLGLDPRGYAADRCRADACVDRDAAVRLLDRLAKNGCAYETQAFERIEMIYPCARLGRAR